MKSAAIGENTSPAVGIEAIELEGLREDGTPLPTMSSRVEYVEATA
jgi:hypothetical protein